MRVAIVHDWMVSSGGGEKVVAALHELWPEAPIFVGAYDPSKFPEFKDADVRPLWLNRFKLAKRKHQLFTIPRAWAFKSLDLSEYDLVISSSSAESKYVKTGPNTVHICYCHTPIRYYWSDYDWYRNNPPFGLLNPLAWVILPILLPLLRRMDYKAAQKVDYFVANSQNVRKRIRKYYDRDADVIYPPVNTKDLKPSAKLGEYFLVLGRQVAYKRLDLAVEAFNKLGLPLVVAGDGEEINRQKPKSNDNIQYLGRVTDAKKAELMTSAKAFIFPAEEDFGIVLVEAMAAGRPVLAYDKGGATESVIDGTTGILFNEQTADSLIDAIEKFNKTKFSPSVIRKHAEKFDEQVFKTKIRQLVADKLKAGK